MSSRFHLAARRSGICSDRVVQYESQPKKFGLKIESTLKAWASAAKEKFSDRVPTHAKALDLSAKLGGFADWQSAHRLVQRFESLHSAEDIRLGHYFDQSALLLQMLRFSKSRHVSRTSIESVKDLADRCAQTFAVPLTDARDFVATLCGVPWVGPFIVTLFGEPPQWSTETSDEPLYSFVVVEGARTFGEFRRTLSGLRMERNLRYSIEKYLNGSATLDEALWYAALLVATRPDFLFGRFWVARLLLERGSIDLAGESFRSAYEIATDLMPRDFGSYMSYGAAANDVYLEGVESYLYFLARTETYDVAFALIKKLFWYAYEDNDFRTQYVAVILRLMAGRDEQALSSGNFAGLNSGLGTADLLRAMVLAANSEWDAAAEELVSALSKLPVLTFAMTHGVTEKDPCLPRHWFVLLIERRPDLKQTMTRALEHPAARAWRAGGETAESRRALIAVLATAMKEAATVVR